MLSGEKLVVQTVSTPLLYVPTKMALKMPPNAPGIPCRLWMPQVSYRPNFFSRKGVMQWKPKVETTPASKPIPSATAGQQRIPATAPMATPPASEAFRMSSISNLLPRSELKMKVDKQLPVRAYKVLATTTPCSQKLYVYTPKMKEGQQSHRNRVPIIAKMLELQSDSALLRGLIFLPNTQLIPSPKQAPKVWMVVLPPASQVLILSLLIISLKGKRKAMRVPTISSCLGPTRPMIPPNAMSTDATQYDDLVMRIWSTLMQLPESSLKMVFQNPLKRMYSWMTMALMKKVQASAEQAWVLMKVMRKPKPINIITLVSCQAPYL